MSGKKSGRPSYLVYCLLAVILFGSYALLIGFQDDNSATMAPNLTLGLAQFSLRTPPAADYGEVGYGLICCKVDCRR
jgi:hypothetical protein